MAAVTDNDLKELKDLINSRFDELARGQKNLEEGQKNLEEGQKNLEEGQKALEIGQAKIEGRLDAWSPSIQKIPDLAEKVGELKNWRQIVIIVVTATVSGVIGWLVRGGNLR